MSETSRKQQKAKLRNLLQEEGAAVRSNTEVFNRGRYESVAELEDYEALKQEARAIKEDAIERLPELIDQVTDTVEANGGTVYLAEDAADANGYVREVVEETGDTVVKSKSMTTEEIELNDALETAGLDVIETDLGEFVLQVADEAPSHIVAPAIHKSREGIADLFNEHFDPETPLETAEELTAFAAEVLGERIGDADVGVTGANFIVAETGTLAIVTSEGNARKCIAGTDTHVAVAGVEKLIPAVTDLQPFVELIGRSFSGQDLTSYVSFFTPPVETPVVDPGADSAGGEGAEDRTFHLVLLDNGRMEMLDDEDLRETLYCIRCSACANSCANFQSVGGHGFGGETYSGGIATGWEAGVYGLDTAAEFNDLCTGCTRCVNQCPVGIDIPWINTVVRDRINRGTDPSTFDPLVTGLTPDVEPGGLSLQKRLFGNFETLARLGSATAPVSNWLPELPGGRAFADRFVGIDPRRDLPQFQRETLVDWFRDRNASTPEAPERRVVLYPDVYTNYIRVERGRAAVRVLEALGVEVEVPELPGSGRAPLSQGMIATAQEKAEATEAALRPYLERHYDVVVIEPSDLAMFREDYHKLLSTEDADRLAEQSYDLFEFLYGLLENDAEVDALYPRGDRVAYHSHCQQRTLGLAAYTTAVLERLGYDVVTSEVECCGMAGSFGYKSQFYDVSVDVGEQLAQQFRAKDVDDRLIVASGTSCQEQLDSLLERRSRHPIELLASGAA